MTASGFLAPVPIEMPHTGAARRAARLTHTSAVIARRAGWKLGRAAIRRPVPSREMARAWRRVFERLGGTYVKLGQIIGSAPGMFGDDVADEFRGFLDTGPPVALRNVREAVERDLGRPLESCFQTFEDRPVAAASLAVVHRATLPDGRVVAVKILRPDIERLLATDMDAIEPLLRFLALRGLEFAIPLLQLVAGSRQQLGEEVDLRNEARTMDHFRDVFSSSGLDRIVVPRVHADLSGRRVLTMEYLDGVPVDSPERLGEEVGDPSPLVEQMIRAWMLTALRDGAFHADIHAGNIFLLRDGRLGMLDWGIVGRLDPDTLVFMRRLVEAALGDESAWTELGRHVVRLAGPNATESSLGFSEDELGQLLRAQIEPLLTKPFGEVGLSTLNMSRERAGEIIGRPLDPPAKSDRAARRARRRTTQAIVRRALEDNLLDVDWYRANFLLSKQLLYLERYGKKYLADVALLADEGFLRSVIAEARG